MKKKAAAITLVSLLMVSTAAAIDLGNFFGDSNEGEAERIDESTADKLDFSASGTTISDIKGMFGFFSIVTGGGEPGPGDEVTFETTLNIDNWATACDQYISPSSIELDVWLEGQAVSKSGTKDTVSISCYGDGTADTSIDFDLPNAGGEFEYDFMVGSSYDTLSGTNSWSQVVETDSVNVEVEELTAEISSTTREAVKGETITFDGTSSDGYGGIDKYEWYVDGSKVGTGRTLDHKFVSSGSHEVELRVSDYAWRSDYLGERRWSSTTTTVNIVSDPDGDGIIDDECPNEAGLERYDGCPDPDPDDDGVEDDDCPETYGELSNGCPNDEPEIQQVSYSPDPVYTGESAEIEINAIDLNDQRLTYSTSYNGEERTGSNPSFTFKSSGTKTINIEVSDGIDTVEKTLQVEVVEPEELDTSPEENESESDDTTGEDSSTGSGETGTEDLSPLEQIFYGFISLITG